MKRARMVLLNVGLLCLSLALVFGMAWIADRALGSVLATRLWPGPLGLLFQPGTEDHWEMHDYSCSERINSLGFRDAEVPLRKTVQVRIAAIGDSFTYGWGVNIEDTWCKRLERNLREQGLDVEVLNLGRPAAGPEQYASIAQTVATVLHPDLIIVGCLAGDDLNQVGPSTDYKAPIREVFPNFTHLVRYWRHRRQFGSAPAPVARTAEECRKINIDTAKSLVDQMPPEQRARFDQIEPSIREVFFAGKLNPWLLNHSTGSPDYFMPTSGRDSMDYQIHYTSKAFRRLKKVSRRVGIPIIVYSIPEGFYVNEEAHKNVQRIGFNVVPEMLVNTAADDAVRAACERVGLEFRCVTAGFREHAQETGLYFELDRHFTAAGNALYADLIAPMVADDIRKHIKP